jgi:hypothetical protein
MVIIFSPIFSCVNDFIISSVCRLLEIVEVSSHHGFIKLGHVVLSFAFAAHFLPAPLMALLVGNIPGLVEHR